MNDFFRKCMAGNKKERWIDFFDWIFVEKKFDGWDKRKKDDYTKKIKALEGFDKKAYFLKTSNIPKRTNKFAIYMSVKNGQAISLVKHIRNSIAHGRVNHRNIRNVDYIEMRDYYNDKPTAYLVIPVSFLLSIKELYDELA